MLHAKFQDHRTQYKVYKRRFLKMFTIYGHGSHLGYVSDLDHLYPFQGTPHERDCLTKRFQRRCLKTMVMHM